MPTWLRRIFGKGTKDAIVEVGGVIERIADGHLGKKEAKLAIEEILDRKDARASNEAVAEIQAKERVLVAELVQGDNYTKRARPTVVYVGLAAALIDAIGSIDFTMPADFWYVWAGVSGVWVIGRSAEKMSAKGMAGRVAGAVTGGTPTILGD